MQSSIFHAYVRLARNAYPGISHQHDDESMFIFVNIDRTMLYRIRQGDIKKATSTDISNVKRWFQECEQGLLNTDSIGSIFRLKSMFNYNDNLAPVPIEMQNQVLNANQLPDLSAKSSEKLLADSQGSKPGNV